MGRPRLLLGRPEQAARRLRLVLEWPGRAEERPKLLLGRLGQAVRWLRLVLGRLRWLLCWLGLRHQPFGCRGLFFGWMGGVPLLAIAAFPVRGWRRHVALPFCSTPG